MKYHIRTYLLFFILCAVQSIVAQDTITFRDVTFTDTTPFDTIYQPGYGIFRYEVKNNSDEEKDIRFQTKNDSRFSVLEYKTQLQPHEEKTIYLLAIPEINIDSVYVYVDNEECQDVFLANCSRNRNISIYVSSSLNRDTLADLYNSNMSSRASHSIDCEFIRARCPIDKWADTWLAYSAFPAVFITNDEYLKMPQNIRKALLKYAKMGGMLCILGNVAIPDEYLSVEEHETYSFVNYGFGKILICNTTDIKSIDEHILNIILKYTKRDDIKAKMYSWGPYFLRKDIISSFISIMKSITITNPQYSVIVLLLALVLGPLNIFIIRLINKRMWIYFTTPALAICVFAAVFLYVRKTEGTTGQIQHKGITLLDQRYSNAVTLYVSGFYTPTHRAEGLHYPRDAYLYEYNTKYTGFNNSEIWVDWTEDQHIKKGGLSVRLPRYYEVQLCEKRDETLHIDFSDDTLYAYNRLDAPVTKVWFMSPSGAVYYGENIPVNDRVSLLATNVVYNYCDLFTIRSSFMELIAKQQDTTPWNVLTPGMYAATLAGTPFIPNGLTEDIHVTGTNWVIGVTDGVTR